MKTEPHIVKDTIIIGAGVAGLGCARQLHKHDKDFLLITKNIGGRILTSDDGLVNYGAYFVLSNFKHILPFVSRTQRLHPFSVNFHDSKDEAFRLINMYKYPVQGLRLIYLLYKFLPLYKRFKKKCETKGQKEVILGNPELKHLYHTIAIDFVKEKKIAELAEIALSQGIYMCTFLPLSKVSAFDFMRLCLALILPAHEFVFRPDKAIEGFEDKIRIDAVRSIENKMVRTKSGKVYNARHIVICTPPETTKQLTVIESLKEASNAYVFHISGKLRDCWMGGQFVLFGSEPDTIFIRKQADDSYIFYSRTANPDLEKYFTKVSVIFKKHWVPAFHIIGDVLLDFDLGDGVFLAGDHNIIGLEDAYITGMCAANRIMDSEL